MDEIVNDVNDVKLWGEYEECTSKFQRKDILSGIEHDVILNSVKNINLRQCFFNPEKQSNFIPIKKEVEFIEMDNTMKDIMKMLKYRDDVKDIVEKAKLRRDVDQSNEQILSLPIPKLLQDKREQIVNRKHFPIRHESNFFNGICDEKPMSISSESALNALSTSIATILAFIGFTETSVLPLQVLTEIVEEYIRKMLKLLKFNVEKEKLRGESGFCDVVDRTFHEMGVGSLKNLVVYYQNSIENYKIKKLKEVKDELRVCENTMDKMKEEQRQINGRSIILEDDHSAIPELHVTSILGNELLSGSFETGLQMLHTIENNQLTDVDSNSVIENDVSMQSEYNDAKSIKRKRK